MELKNRYSALIDFAEKSKVKDLSVSEENGVLHLSGTADNATKDKMWELYNQIDPDMRSGDLVMNIQVDESSQMYEVQPGDSLSKIAKKYPDMNWKKIYEVNRDIIKDPNIIYPGQKIKIPQ